MRQALRPFNGQLVGSHRNERIQLFRVEKRFCITGKPGKWFWSNGSAWGTVTVAQDRATVEIIEGSLEIDSFFCGGRKFKKLKNVPYTYTKG